VTTGQLLHRLRPPTPVVRTPDPPLARPRDFVRMAWLDLRRSRTLTVEMARRDIRSQLRQPVLGCAAVVLPVLVMTAAGLGFRSAGLLGAEATGMPYGLFVLTGLILWMTFLDALYAPIHGLLAEQRLLSRTSAPAEAIILAKLGPVVFHAGIRFLLLVPAVVWYGTSLPGTIVLAPVGLAGLIAFGTAVGVVLAPVNLVYRDVSRLLVAVTTLLLFLSPVYFPTPGNGTIGAIMSLNPIAPLLASTRTLALAGHAADAGPTVAMLVLAGLLLVAAWAYVRVALPIALERPGD
jgi:lipopolysaccharide transport system permease protein